MQIEYPVESNGVFVRIPKAVETHLHGRGWYFYTGVITGDESRLIGSWDTTAENADDFLANLREFTT